MTPWRAPQDGRAARLRKVGTDQWAAAARGDNAGKALFGRSRKARGVKSLDDSCEEEGLDEGLVVDEKGLEVVEGLPDLGHNAAPSVEKPDCTVVTFQEEVAECGGQKSGERRIDAPTPVGEDRLRVIVASVNREVVESGQESPSCPNV